MKLNAEGDAAFLQFDTDTVKLSPLLRVAAPPSE